MPAPHLVGRAHERGMAANGVDAVTQQRCLGVGFGRQRRPDQAAAPVVDHVAAGVPRKLLAK